MKDALELVKYCQFWYFRMKNEVPREFTDLKAKISLANRKVAYNSSQKEYK